MAEVACKILAFDGTDDEAEIPDNAAYDVTSAMSFHVWLRRAYSDTASTFLYRENTIKVEWDALDRLKVTISGVTAVTFHRGFQKEVVHAFGVAIYESDTSLNFELYYNGLLDEIQSVAASAMPAATNTAYFIGSDSGSVYWKGRMTNFVSTSDRLTAAEFATIYASGMLIQDVADYDSDMICFPFNEGTGTSLDNDGLAGVDGTLAGSPTWPLGIGAHTAVNPMILQDQDDEFHELIWVDTIEWVAPTTGEHLAELTNWAGERIIQVKCAVAHDGGGQKLIDRRLIGFKVPDLDSGYLILRWR